MGEPSNNPTQYRELVGVVVYLTISRLSIAYVVHMVSLFWLTFALYIVLF